MVINNHSIAQAVRRCMTLEAIRVPVGVVVVKGGYPLYPSVSPVSIFGYPSIP